MRLSGNFISVEEIYLGLKKCYDSLNDVENSLKYFQQMAYLSFENKSCPTSRKLTYLGNFIKDKIKFNNLQGLYELF